MNLATSRRLNDTRGSQGSASPPRSDAAGDGGAVTHKLRHYKPVGTGREEAHKGASISATKARKEDSDMSPHVGLFLLGTNSHCSAVAFTAWMLGIVVFLMIVLATSHWRR